MPSFGRRSDMSQDNRTYAELISRFVNGDSRAREEIRRRINRYSERPFLIRELSRRAAEDNNPEIVAFLHGVVGESETAARYFSPEYFKYLVERLTQPGGSGQDEQVSPKMFARQIVRAVRYNPSFTQLVDRGAFLKIADRAVQREDDELLWVLASILRSRKDFARHVTEDHVRTFVNLAIGDRQSKAAAHLLYILLTHGQKDLVVRTLPAGFHERIGGRRDMHFRRLIQALRVSDEK